MLFYDNMYHGISKTCVTFCYQQVIRIIRSAAGRWNLAKKTLVDKRFLI